MIPLDLALPDALAEQSTGGVWLTGESTDHQAENELTNRESFERNVAGRSNSQEMLRRKIKKCPARPAECELGGVADPFCGLRAQFFRVFFRPASAASLGGFALITEHKADEDAVFYIDPPYTVAARRLYTKWQLDHVRLFHLMSTCKGDFLMSYDNTAEIASLANQHGFQTRPIAMKNTHHAKMTELLIGKDLSWLPSRI